MTLVVLGIDALDSQLVSADKYPNLTLASHRSIKTIDSTAGEPSTHELWPTIITGLEPKNHGLVLDEGVAWENPLLRHGSNIADYVLPDPIQTRLGGWLLNRTNEDAFRVPSTYYEENDIATVFDGRNARAIGIPNYVVDPDEEDREHQLRRSMGDLFERDPDAMGGHRSSDPRSFYELCLEMAMIRIARVRRTLRGRRHELVFGYTSGLDLVGHVSYDRPELQQQAYGELNDFVGELRADLKDEDELLLVSDHGLQEGLHTHEAMVAATNPSLIVDIDSVVDVRAAIESELDTSGHQPRQEFAASSGTDSDTEVRDQLEDLGYL
jgi:hypothetical protein